MKPIIASAVLITMIVTCLTINVQAKSFNHLSPVAATVPVADTGKMAKMKGKMAKAKTAKDTVKKMAKDTTKK